ncbi:MAG: hypothetical protein ACO1TE_21900, partial [Prosthecobacter sp.]
MIQTEAEPLVHRTDLTDLASFDDSQAAERCCQHLEANGVDTHFYDESGLQSVVFLTKPKASLKIQVAEEDYGRAVQLLIDFEKENPQVAASIYSCPDCGSFAVEYPQFSRKFMTPLFLEWLSNLGLFKKQCYCRKCHSTWPKSRNRGINRHHLAPTSSVFVPPPG